MDRLITKHYKLIWLAGFFLAGLLLFRSVLPMILVVFSVAVVFEPYYLQIIRSAQRRGLPASLVSNAVILLFLLVFTAGAVCVAGFPLLYLKNNLDDITRLSDQVGDFVTRYIPTVNFQSIAENTTARAVSRITDEVGSLPQRFMAVLSFYIALFLAIKYLPFIRRDISSIVPEPWQKNLRRLYHKTRTVVRAFYVVHVAIAVIVFLFSLFFFWALKAPDVLFFSILTALLQLIPFVGAASVVLAMTIFYTVNVDIARLLFVVLIGYPLLVVVPEMVLRPWLMGKGAHISMGLTILGVLLGIRVMGAYGIIFGPLVLVLFVDLFKLVVDHYGRRDQTI